MEILTLWPFSQGEMTSVREGFIDALFSKQPVWSSEKSREGGRDELMEKVLIGGYPLVIGVDGITKTIGLERDSAGVLLSAHR